MDNHGPDQERARTPHVLGRPPGQLQQVDCVRTRSIRALMLVLAPATFAAAPLEAFSYLTATGWPVAGLIAAALLFAGVTHRVQGVAVRLLASAAFAAWTAGSIVEHASNPAHGLAVMLGAVVFFAFVWPSQELRRWAHERNENPPELALWVSGAAATLLGLEAMSHGGSDSSAVSLGVAVSSVVFAGIALRHKELDQRGERYVVWFAAAWAALALGTAVLGTFGPPVHLPLPGLLSPALVLVLVSRRGLARRLSGVVSPGETGFLDATLAYPSRVLVISFAAICAIGAVALALPISSRSGVGLPWLDAAFTAVSATCVTGLAVVDTPTTFSGLGQLLVLCLIQLGGLGMMVFSAAALVLLGRRLSMSHERVAVDLVGAPGRAALVRAIRWVFLVTAVTEAAAALLLTAGFLGRGDGLGMALWRGLFTAVSAFCNAGFALQSDSLVSYADSPFILTVIAVAIVIGGLGPAVVAAIIGWREPVRRTVHARVVLWTTALLLVLPALFMVVVEWNGSLAELTWGDKLVNAAFQSVTLRTAGFNAIDLTELRPVTWTLSILVMFVGGSPASTAGGVKTTTIAVVILSIVAVVRGRQRVELFGRTLPQGTVMRATAVTALGALGCCIALAAVQLTQPIPLDVAVFEVVSALATVGLSTGGTAMLDEVGKLLIIACMFAGRVGPLTLFVFLASQQDERLIRSYPEEPVPIG